MPIVVPVSTREPKCTFKQSVAKPFKKTVASKSNQKPRNITRKVYERVSKACSWWYSKFTPSGYKWTPKSEKENVNLNLVEIVLSFFDSKLMVSKFRLERRRCHNHACDDVALAIKQIGLGEFVSLSVIEYKSVPREPN
uniref:Uncharacterized protein n=1 Tax=Tanacetum cinerariifolium TaxID=118510 RepID=A0A699Q9L9_TANCI|nr:hypothetical protein [Tanacetum cinerariifolium]